MKTTNTTTMLLAISFVTGIFAANLFAEGMVTAEVDNGDLSIVGENNREQGILIEGTGVPGEFTVFSADGSTTINGLAEQTFVGVTGDVTIDLRSGPKFLLMSEGASDTLFIGGDLEIKNRGNTGVGIILDEVEVAGRLDFKLKGGDDAIILYGTVVDDRTRINTGNGNDAVFSSFESEFSDKLEFKTGGGADYVLTFGTTVFGETDVRTGGQSDTIGLYNSILGDLSVNGNGGTDALEVADVESLDYDERSIENTFAGGLPAMFAEARTFNQNFDDVVVIFTFFGLAD